MSELRQKCLLEMCSMKQKEMFLINKTLAKEKTTLYQTVTLYWFLLFDLKVESSTDDVELFIELVRRFPVIWNPTLLKTTRKRKTLETKLTLTLVGAF